VCVFIYIYRKREDRKINGDVAVNNVS